MPQPTSTAPPQTANLQPLPLFRSSSSKRSIAKPALLTTVAVVLALVVGLTSWHTLRFNQQAAQALQTQPASTQLAVDPTPQVASATFGDILKNAQNYDDWIAGVVDGSVEVANPQTGQIERIITAEHKWQGPIGPLIWSPDRTKIATLYLSTKDAQAMQHNAASHAQSLGLDAINQPDLFPYGQVTIIDVIKKQKITTSLEVKNTLKPLVWIDNDRLAFITSTLMVYTLSTDSSQALVAAGSTGLQEQLQSPLVWKSDQQQLFFIKTKQVDQQPMQLLARLSLANAQVDELLQFKTHQDQRPVAQTVDIALSADQQKLAIIEPLGLSYVDLESMARHNLAYHADHLWMERVVIRHLDWLNPSQVGFEVIYADGDRAWAGWDTQQNLVPIFAKGSTAAAWLPRTGQLVATDRQQSSYRLLNPNWSDPSQTTSQGLALGWDKVFK